MNTEKKRPDGRPTPRKPAEEAATPSPAAQEKTAGEETTALDPDELERRVVEALKNIFDPEIPVNIYDMGLIYEVKIYPINNVYILMTLTTPMCPVAQSLPQEVEEKVRAIEGVNDVQVELTFDPPWDISMMSQEARIELGI